MARTLSAAVKQALYGPQTGEALLQLLTLRHVSLSEPIRVVNDGAAVVSQGLRYEAFPFELGLPSETEDGPPVVTLRICSIDRRVIAAIRALPSPPTVELSVIAASAPDQVEIGPLEFTLRNATYDQAIVEGELHYEDLLNEPYPKGAFTPSRTPGVFRTGTDLT